MKNARAHPPAHVKQKSRLVGYLLFKINGLSQYSWQVVGLLPLYAANPAGASTNSTQAPKTSKRYEGQNFNLPV